MEKPVKQISLLILFPNDPHWSVLVYYVFSPSYLVIYSFFFFINQNLFCARQYSKLGL